MLLGKVKFKKQCKVNVGDGNVHIWGLNVTNRGNCQMESRGKSVPGVVKQQKECQHVEDRMSKVERRRKNSERKLEA